MTRRPIPFPGSAFFFGPAPAPGRRGGPRHDETKPRRQDAPVAAALCRTKGSPARSRTEGKRSTRNAPLRSALRPREPRTRPARPQPPHCPESRPDLCPGTARKAPCSGSAICPSGRARLRRTFEQTGAASLFAPDSPRAPVPKVAISPSAFRTPLQPLSPQPSPASGPADKKKPRRPGAKHEEGKRSRLNRPTAGT